MICQASLLDEIRRGAKTAGWIVGGALVGMILVAAAMRIKMALRNVAGPRERARRISCASNLKSTGCALRMYSSDWSGHFPPMDGADGLEFLRSQGYCESWKMYTCPSTSTTGRDGHAFTEENVDYHYFGGYLESDDVNFVLMCDKAGNHRKYGNALFIDGHVAWFKVEDWDNFVAMAKAMHKGVVGPRRDKEISD